MNQETMAEQLERLRAEHSVLDEQIREMTNGGVYDDVQILRLKKRKLAIKDEINRLESQLAPEAAA